MYMVPLHSLTALRNQPLSKVLVSLTKLCTKEGDVFRVGVPHDDWSLHFGGRREKKREKRVSLS